MSAHLEEGARVERRAWPPDALREAVVNAFVHRDWSIQGTDVEVSIYADRVDVISPGALPNTVTVDRMRAGVRHARNELVRDAMRDYRYLEADGLGVPRTIVRGMLEHSGIEPVFRADEQRLVVTLPIAPHSGGQ
jgi:ATP-dependent DNA helicase RecG